MSHTPTHCIDAQRQRVMRLQACMCARLTPAYFCSETNQCALAYYYHSYRKRYSNGLQHPELSRIDSSTVSVYNNGNTYCSALSDFLHISSIAIGTVLTEARSRLPRIGAVD